MSDNITAVYTARISVTRKEPDKWCFPLWPRFLDSGALRVALFRSLQGVISADLLRRPEPPLIANKPIFDPRWDTDGIRSVRITIEVEIDREKLRSRRFSLIDIERLNAKVEAALLAKWPTPGDVPLSEAAMA